MNRRTFMKGLICFAASAVMCSAGDLQLLFSRDASSVIARNTEQVRKYTLLESTNLLDSNGWNEVSTLRGNGGDLSFGVDMNKHQGFYKVKSEYQPLEPMVQDIEYPHDPHQKYPTVNPITVNNYSDHVIKAVIKYTETMNPYGLVYTTNMPLTNNIAPGSSNIDTICYWSNYSGTGGTIYGQLNLEIIQ